MDDYEIIYYYQFEHSEKIRNFLWNKYEKIIVKIAYIIYRKFNAIPLEFQDLKTIQYQSFLNSLLFFRQTTNKKFYNYMQLRLKWDILQYIRKYVNKNHAIINYATNYDKYSGWLNIDSDRMYLGNDLEKFTLTSQEFSYLSKIETNVILLKIQAYNNEEIAKILKTTYKAVDNAYQRAKHKIKKYKNLYW